MKMLVNLEQLHDNTEAHPLAKVVADLKEKGLVFFYTEGEWSLHDQLEELLLHYAPAKMYMSTFSITEFPARIISTLMDAGKITELNVLLDYEFQKRYPKVNQFVSAYATRIGYSRVHAKIMVLETKDQLITVLGSANWTINPRLESGLMTTDYTTGMLFKNKINALIDDTL